MPHQTYAFEGNNNLNQLLGANKLRYLQEKRSKLPPNAQQLLDVILNGMNSTVDIEYLEDTDIKFPHCPTVVSSCATTPDIILDFAKMLHAQNVEAEQLAFLGKGGFSVAFKAGLNNTFTLTPRNHLPAPFSNELMPFFHDTSVLTLPSSPNAVVRSCGLLNMGVSQQEAYALAKVLARRGYMVEDGLLLDRSTHKFKNIGLLCGDNGEPIVTMDAYGNRVRIPVFFDIALLKPIPDGHDLTKPCTINNNLVHPALTKDEIEKWLDDSAWTRRNRGISASIRDQRLEAAHNTTARGTAVDENSPY